MALIGLLNAYGSTVGDNLEHTLIRDEILRARHTPKHLWNFNTQRPRDVHGCHGLVVGGGGVLWNGSDLRNYFFINVIMASKKALGVSVGYNQTAPLGPRWVHAVNRMSLITVRDPWTERWVKVSTCTPYFLAPSIAWLYTPPNEPRQPQSDIGLIYNQKAWAMNYGSGHPFSLFPGLKGLNLVEIPYAQPVEQPILKFHPNPLKLPALACAGIRRCRVIVTSRLHGFILALLCGVPALCIDDTFKLTGQAEMCRYPWVKPLHELRGLNQEGWKNLIEKVAGLDVAPFTKCMRTHAQVHRRELGAWLKNF